MLTFQSIALTLAALTWIQMAGPGVRLLGLGHFEDLGTAVLGELQGVHEHSSRFTQVCQSRCTACRQPPGGPSDARASSTSP